ncbi:MAG: hypothetical protein JWM98_3433, partial [Thermoleophilia bacterium]|nr:hypothetical protein [Thermoleophilia bacterium]
MPVCGDASSTGSSTTVTVTFCAAAQFVVVKVSVAGAAVVWPSGVVMPTVTGPAGLESRRTANVAVVPT